MFFIEKEPAEIEIEFISPKNKLASIFQTKLANDPAFLEEFLKLTDEAADECIRCDFFALEAHMEDYTNKNRILAQCNLLLKNLLLPESQDNLPSLHRSPDCNFRFHCPVVRGQARTGMARGYDSFDRLHDISSSNAGIYQAILPVRQSTPVKWIEFDLVMSVKWE